MSSPEHFAREKGDKALKLFEQGLARSVIAERLGVKPVNVPGMIQRARQRRDQPHHEESQNG